MASNFIGGKTPDLREYAETSTGDRIPQIDRQLSLIAMGLDGLQEVVEKLLNKLEPIAGQVGMTPTAMPGQIGCTSEPLVPLASRLSNFVARLNAQHDILRRMHDSIEL